jgi:UDP-N-acetyl-D-mannosaminuronic acid dehydrogenase
MDTVFERDVVVVGGCGHVGLPLAIAFASRGLSVGIYDIDENAVAEVGAGQMPFRESGADDLLRTAVSSGQLVASSHPEIVSSGEYLVVVIGTPVDEHMNPDPRAVPAALAQCGPYLRDGQHLVLRSTVYPGVTARVEALLAGLGVDVEASFCPERIAEGHAMTELFSLPQIVAARSPEARARARQLFLHLTDRIVELEPEEAELAKLFTNAWRYIKFAAANQFFVMANDHGLDFAKIHAAVVGDYPRAADMPGAGFSAGPCLLKDTMQLASFMDNSFILGHAAMLVNEGLPLYLTGRLERHGDLSEKTVGILGMAFKGGSDDTRDSLSYKLKRILQFRAGAVVCTDPYVTTDPALVSLDEALEKSDLLVIAAPHQEYKDIDTSTPIVDVWNLLGNGTLV